jgi:hypothetical protein
MVKIINRGDKHLFRRIGTGHNVEFPPNQEVEITDEKLIEAIKGRKRVGNLQIKDSVGKENVGGGIKTGIRPAKRRGRPPKSRKHLEESKQASKKIKPPKSVIDKVRPKSLKKPKGLNKKKGIGIDLDGDGKVDVIVGGD